MNGWELVMGLKLIWHVGIHRRELVEPWCHNHWHTAWVLQEGSEVLDWGWGRTYVEEVKAALGGRGRIYRAKAVQATPKESVRAEQGAAGPT